MQRCLLTQTGWDIRGTEALRKLHCNTLDTVCNMAKQCAGSVKLVFRTSPLPPLTCSARPKPSPNALSQGLSSRSALRDGHARKLCKGRQAHEVVQAPRIVHHSHVVPSLAQLLSIGPALVVHDIALCQHHMRRGQPCRATSRPGHMPRRRRKPGWQCFLQGRRMKCNLSPPPQGHAGLQHGGGACFSSHEARHSSHRSPTPRRLSSHQNKSPWHTCSAQEAFYKSVNEDEAITPT